KKIGAIYVELCILKNQYVFIWLIIKTKIKYLMDTLIYSLNNDNHLILALISRSLIEHAASLSYLLKWTQSKLEELSGLEDYEDINKIIENLCEVYKKIFYGTRFFKKEGLVEAVNVLTLIDYLSKEIKDIRKYYDYLSDFVHPNFGSNVLVISGELGEGVVGPSIEEKKEIVEGILQIVGGVIEYLRYKIFDFTRLGLMINNYLQRVLHPEIDLSTLFKEPPFEYIGDGKSKETAIFFTKAKTRADHIILQHKFLRQKGIEEKYIFTQIDEGNAYDIYKTPKGDIWFKIPLFEGEDE
ncbi:MAG: hypothetical protein DRI36_04350, partial [Caldiserica bacterium]